MIKIKTSIIIREHGEIILNSMLYLLFLCILHLACQKYISIILFSRSSSITYLIILLCKFFVIIYSSIQSLIVFGVGCGISKLSRSNLLIQKYLLLHILITLLSVIQRFFIV